MYACMPLFPDFHQLTGAHEIWHEWYVSGGHSNLVRLHF